MSWATTSATRRSMKRNVRRDTGPEIAVRRLLHRGGLRYRVDYSPLHDRKRADIVFTRQRVAVFIDGCFWHSCPTHGSSPVRNSSYWLPKLARNRARDSETNASLAEAGWTVLRFWEHERPEEVAAVITAAVTSTRAATRRPIGIEQI